MKSALEFLLCLAVAVCVSKVSPNMELEKMQEMLERDRIERELRREFKKLGQSKVSDSAPRPSPEALDLMMSRYDVEEKKPPTEVMFPPAGSFDCKWLNDTTCRRFEYNVSPNVIPSTAKLMVYEAGLTSLENLTIWAFCLNSSGDGISTSDVLERKDEEEKNGWLLYTFTVLQNLTFWKDSAECGIEISGLSANNSNPPSLLIQKNEEQANRIRRQAEETPRPTNTTNTTNTAPPPTNRCRVVPFNISFTEMGLDRDIVHPKEFEAGFCTGTCQGGQWEFLMNSAFLHNRSLESSHGRCWATCCRPREYGHITMIHAEKREDGNATTTTAIANDGNNNNRNDTVYAHRVMLNMVVKSCWCA